MVEWVKWQTNGANRNSNFYMKNKLLTIKCKDSILSGQEASNYHLQRHRVGQYQKKWRIIAQTGYLQDDTWTSLFNEEDPDHHKRAKKQEIEMAQVHRQTLEGEFAADVYIDRHQLDPAQGLLRRAQEPLPDPNHDEP